MAPSRAPNGGVKRYKNSAWFNKNFRTFLEALSEVSLDAQVAGGVLASIYAVGVSLATMSVNPSWPPSNWHQKYARDYRRWLKTQALAKKVSSLEENEEDGTEVAFLKEFLNYLRPIVNACMPRRVRLTRDEFDGKEPYYPEWALEKTEKVADIIQAELLAVTKEHFSRPPREGDALINLRRVEISYNRALVGIKEGRDFPPFQSTPYMSGADYTHYWSCHPNMSDGIESGEDNSSGDDDDDDDDEDEDDDNPDDGIDMEMSNGSDELAESLAMVREEEAVSAGAMDPNYLQDDTVPRQKYPDHPNRANCTQTSTPPTTTNPYSVYAFFTSN
ncbi:hypothetical protein CC80DRAFT_552029 [Byssothecium circinans]|uniref:Uncharacterized protein n=1 Tax=Byssothecium circinans TaxID=147558 RepID=A0A6A5TJG8_9PLEO|nr:hypothetical protein CC80DRAFT_552029 [Byssothecium circinans]